MTPEATLHTALFWLVVGAVTASAAWYLLGEWWRARGVIRFTDAAERRLRALPPLPDTWTQWPRRPR